MLRGHWPALPALLFARPEWRRGRDVGRACNRIDSLGLLNDHASTIHGVVIYSQVKLNDILSNWLTCLLHSISDIGKTSRRLGIEYFICCFQIAPRCGALQVRVRATDPFELLSR